MSIDWLIQTDNDEVEVKTVNITNYQKIIYHQSELLPVFTLINFNDEERRNQPFLLTQTVGLYNILDNLNLAIDVFSLLFPKELM